MGVGVSYGRGTPVTGPQDPGASGGGLRGRPPGRRRPPPQERGRLNQLLCRNVQWFRGGLVFKAHRRLYHSDLAGTARTGIPREIKKQSLPAGYVPVPAYGGS